MSMLGIAWNDNGLLLSCRPDPARPAGLLEHFCDVTIPEAAQAGAAPPAVLLQQLLTGTSLTTSGSETETRVQALADYLHRLVDDLNSDPSVSVLLLEQDIDHLTFLVPHGVPASQARAFSASLQQIHGLRTTAVSEPVAAAAHAMGSLATGRPFLLCEWDGDLVIGPAVANDDLIHCGRHNRRRTLPRIGPKTWPGLLESWLARKHGIGWRQNLPTLQACVEKTELERALSRAVEALLRGAADHVLRLVGTDRATGSSREIEIILTIEVCRAAFMPLILKLRRFLEANLAATGNGCERKAVWFGLPLRVPFLRDIIKETFLAQGWASPILDADAALLGLHECVPPPPPSLPYDVGVAIRTTGAPLGIGTLVLVRPTSIGESRTSETLEIPTGGNDLEVAFYVRRLDFASGLLSYEIMQSHLFSPTIDDEGHAHMRVTMTVEAAHESVVGTSVTIALEDCEADESLHFERLPLTGGDPMSQPPARDPGEAVAWKWAEKARDVAARFKGDRSAAEWRRFLEGRGSLVSRYRYWQEILMAAAAIMAGTSQPVQKAVGKTLLKEDWARQAPSERFQQEARKAILARMHHLAGEVGRSHAQAWRRKAPPFTRVPLPDDSIARDFVNALSQDLAGRAEESDHMPRVHDLKRLFNLACQDPRNLNVDWKKWPPGGGEDADE